jgi:hypothetical protein
MITHTTGISAFYTIIKKSQLISRLGPRRDCHRLEALDSFNLNFASEHCCKVLKLNIAVDVIAFFRYRITIDAHFFGLLYKYSHIEVAVVVLVPLMAIVFDA